jgi:uncharacterized membrane protein
MWRTGYLAWMSRAGFVLRHRITTSLWFVPVLCLLAGIAVAAATIAIDRATGGDLLPITLTGDPNAALAILSTAAASMVSLTALVLTITGVVVQLAMGQFSPRSVRPFLQDRPSQFAIGVFVGAFAHSMLALREVRSFGDAGYVPSLTIAVSFGLILTSVVVLVAYVHHIGNSLKVDSIIRAVGEETRETFQSLYPGSETGVRATPPDTIVADRAGFVFDVDESALVRMATEADSRLEMLHPIGTFVAHGVPLFKVVGAAGGLDRQDVLSAVAIGPERTMDRDGAFGVQTLVDIAQRSLTESFNDPTTATQAIDRLHDCLRMLATRNLGTGRYEDDGGAVRLVVPVLEWEDYVRIAFDPLLRAAAGSPQVMDGLERALEDLRTVAPVSRRRSLDSRLAAVRESSAARTA